MSPLLPPSSPSSSWAPSVRPSVRRVFEFKSVSLYFPLDKRRSRRLRVCVCVCVCVRPLELNAKEGRGGEEGGEGGILELGIRLLLLLLLLQRRRTQCRLNIPPIHSGSCSSSRKKEREGEIGRRQRE